MGRIIQAADLFCGAGGTSSGLIAAANELGIQVDLTAINHWDIAIKTHSINHPLVRHLCENLDNVNPRILFPNGRLFLLVASPECTHFSIARGGVPCSDQSRSSAFQILRWAEALYIDNIIIENVPEFTSWGPLGANGKPMTSKKGQTFNAFIATLESLGYKCEWRVINTADYGDPTSRRRFFMICRRGNKTIPWPEYTHSEQGGLDLFGETKKWVPAKEIIDWTIEGKSIFDRDKPLKPKTLAKIEHGLKKGGGEKFLLKFYNTCKTASINQPLPTITASGNHLGIVEPFITILKGKSTTRGVNSPLPTLTTKQSLYLCEPFLLKYYGSENNVQDINKPLDTVTTKDRFALIEAFKNTPGFDIRFRMLQPHELAAAQSFPVDYQFHGNKAEQVKQIGNAVPGKTAKALCQALLAA